MNFIAGLIIGGFLGSLFVCCGLVKLYINDRSKFDEVFQNATGNHKL